MDKNPKAFVIMPFDPEFNSIYEQLIKPSLEEAGYEVSRADSFLDQQNILSDIVRGITTADLIVADLTTNNPNVFYELGLCHGLRIPTVLVAQSIEEVPFDLRSYKIQIYETHFNKIHKLKDALKIIGERHKKGEITFGSPVIDFSFKKSDLIENVTEKILADVGDETVEDLEEQGMLDYWVEGEQAGNELTSILSKTLKDNEGVTRKIKRHTANLNALSNNPGAGSAGKFHKVILLAASDMNTFSKKVEDILPQFENTIEKLQEGYLGYINIVALGADAEKEQVEKFRDTIASLLQGASEANESTRSYRDEVLSLGERNISRDLNRASRRQAQALEGIISNIERVEAFCLKSLEVIDEKFGNDLEQ
ncbi:MAG: hypothetical protein H7Y30_03380 [Pyrinomonadaceae bacterium]|nr:hypothetical protein [Pyrinomonadaceae bacterium]